MNLNPRTHQNDPSLQDGRRRRVLVVDDNRDAADTLGALLEILGCEVQAAYDGAAALNAAESFRPNAMLLDIGMPGMDGYEVAREVRNRLGPLNVLLIAVTGWGQEEDFQRTRAAGFDHHLTKPVALESLEPLLLSLDAVEPDAKVDRS